MKYEGRPVRNCSNCMNYVTKKGRYYCKFPLEEDLEEKAFYFYIKPSDEELEVRTRDLAAYCSEYDSSMTAMHYTEKDNNAQKP